MSGQWIGCARWIRSWQRTAEPLVAGCLIGRVELARLQSRAWPGRMGTDNFRARPATEKKTKSKSGSRRYARSLVPVEPSPRSAAFGRPPEFKKAEHRLGSTETNHPRMAWIYSVDQGRHPPRAEHIRSEVESRGHRPTVEGGALWACGGVSGMDAATKPPWTGLRRPPQPDPPRHPTDSQLLTLTLLWPAAGAGQQPCKENPTLSTGAVLLPAPAAGTAP